MEIRYIDKETGETVEVQCVDCIVQSNNGDQFELRQSRKGELVVALFRAWRLGLFLASSKTLVLYADYGQEERPKKTHKLGGG